MGAGPERCQCKRCDGLPLPPQNEMGRRRLYLPGHAPSLSERRRHRAAVTHPGCRQDLDVLLPAWEEHRRLHGLTGDVLMNVPGTAMEIPMEGTGTPDDIGSQDGSAGFDPGFGGLPL